MKKSETRWLAGIGVMLQFLLGSSLVLGQTKVSNIQIDDTQRPMLSAIGMIEDLSGIPINYEDVPVYYADDLKDITPRPLPSTLPPSSRSWHRAEASLHFQSMWMQPRGNLKIHKL